MQLRPGDRVEYVGDAFWDGPEEHDRIEPGDRGIVIDLEPPDDSPIVSFERVGAVVLAPGDVRPVVEA